MSEFLKERLKLINAYTPGEQPQDKAYIKLNTNESPYPPGNEVLKAINSESLKDLRLYPSPVQDLLKDKLAETLTSYYSPDSPISKENLFVSNGSDDILNFSFMAFAGDGIPAVYPDISYGFYSVYAEFQGVESEVIPLDEDFRIRPNEYFFGNERKLIVIANPNAPTGIALSLDEIESIVSNNPGSVVLIDEAYVDFGGESAIGLVPKYRNIIVSRTFSKSASLAGARLGYGIASEELIQDLELIKYSTNPYNINRMTEAVGLAVLGEYDYYMDNCKKIIETREWTAGKLKEFGLRVLESKANFILVGTGNEAEGNIIPATKLSGQNLYLKLKDEGILVRWFNKERIKNYIRITIGSPEEMKSLIDVIQSIKE